MILTIIMLVLQFISLMLLIFLPQYLRYISIITTGLAIIFTILELRSEFKTIKIHNIDRFQILGIIHVINNFNDVR
mgnify:CR=1 FL=1